MLQFALKGPQWAQDNALNWQTHRLCGIPLVFTVAPCLKHACFSSRPLVKRAQQKRSAESSLRLLLLSPGIKPESKAPPRGICCAVRLEEKHKQAPAFPCPNNDVAQCYQKLKAPAFPFSCSLFCLNELISLKNKCKPGIA